MSSQPVAGSRIVSLGHYQPTRVVTNDELAEMVDTSDEWIRTRVGITQRRVADDETVADMSAAAAEKALAGSGFTAADIDLVVVATCSSVDRCPNVATRVAAHLGIHAPGAYDINTACSGFPYALSTVDHAIRAGAARRAIVIGAEKLTDFTDWTDRSTCILFGDGAGAAVVTAAAEGESPGIGPVLWGSAPEMGDVVVIEGWRPYIKQSGQTVFRWATTALPALAREACERAGVDPSDLAAFVPHQANLRIIAQVAQRLEIPLERFVLNIERFGNTSSASIPIALDEAVRDGRIRPGDTVLMCALGGGVSWASALVRM